METSFPDRDNVLRKYSLIGFLTTIFLIFATIGCEPRKQYSVDPLPIFSKVLQIDSSYTTVKVIPTGGSASLFCGKKNIFDSYALLRFGSIPKNPDSLFLRFKSVPDSCELTFFALNDKWYQDSVYEWDTIGFLFDTLNPIRIDTIYPIPVVGRLSTNDTLNDTLLTAVSPDDTNSLIFLGTAMSLGKSTIDAIGNFGLAVHSDRFYSFEAGGTRLKIKMSPFSGISSDSLKDTVTSIYCTEDAYLVKNPFQDSIISDSLLVGRGLSVRTHIFIPRDSLPLYLHSVSKAQLILDVDTAFSFSLRSSVIGVPGFYLEHYTEDDDSLIYKDMATLFQEADVDSVMHIVIRAFDETGGIGLGKLGGGIIKFVWVELPR